MTVTEAISQAEITSFNDFQFDDDINKALSFAGFVKPTSIQQLAIPPAMEGRDILASAPTGTGKTLAFLLPAIQYLIDFPRRDPDTGPGMVSLKRLA